MKHLILWGGLLSVSIVLIFIYEKTSVLTTFWIKGPSPIYVDIILCLFGLFLFFTRASSLWHKLF